MDEDERVLTIVLISIAFISGAALVIGFVTFLCYRSRLGKKLCWSKANTNHSEILDEESASTTSDSTISNATASSTSDRTIPNASARNTSYRTISNASASSISDRTIPNASARITSDRTIPNASARITSDRTIPNASARTTSDRTIPNASPQNQPISQDVHVDALISFESDSAESVEHNKNYYPALVNEWNVRPFNFNSSTYTYNTPKLVTPGSSSHNSYIHSPVAINRGSAYSQHSNDNQFPGFLTNQTRSSFRTNTGTNNIPGLLKNSAHNSTSKPNRTYASVTFNGNLIKLPVSVIKPHGLPSRRNSKTTRKSSSAAASTAAGYTPKSLSPNPQLIIAVDATPQRFGGYVINIQKNLISYYSLHANESPWFLRNRSRSGNPTEFEMKNLFCSLLLWDDLIVSRKQIELYTDNSAIIGNSKYGQRVRDYLKHFTDCLGVQIMNEQRMYVNRSRYKQDFNKFIIPADSLSRTRVNEFELALRKHYPTMEFQSVTNFKKVKETAIHWTKNYCPGCGFSIRSTGSFKRRKINNHHQ